jgi:hypothetical protein
MRSCIERVNSKPSKVNKRRLEVQLSEDIDDYLERLENEIHSPKNMICKLHHCIGLRSNALSLLFLSHIVCGGCMNDSSCNLEV